MSKGSVVQTPSHWFVKPWVVRLDEGELLIGETVGKRRRAFAIKNRIQPKDGAPVDERAERIDILGCFGEIAVAKALNLFWQPAISYCESQIDVGGAVEVRTTDLDHGGLIMKDSDKEYLPYVLVIAKPPYFKLCGWMSGFDAKRDEFWEEQKLRVPNWLVPQGRLLPMDSLAVEVGKRMV